MMIIIIIIATSTHLPESHYHHLKPLEHLNKQKSTKEQDMIKFEFVWV